VSSSLNMPHRVGTHPILMNATPVFCPTRTLPSRGDTAALAELVEGPNFTVEEDLRRTLAPYQMERSLLRSSMAVLETP
jgi:hypothetical protein